jgi:hypothetical protein
MSEFINSLCLDCAQTQEIEVMDAYKLDGMPFVDTRCCGCGAKCTWGGMDVGELVKLLDLIRSYMPVS